MLGDLLSILPWGAHEGEINGDNFRHRCQPVCTLRPGAFRQSLAGCHRTGVRAPDSPVAVLNAAHPCSRTATARLAFRSVMTSVPTSPRASSTRGSILRSGTPPWPQLAGCFRLLDVTLQH
jgi:hypothetical protein